MSVTNPIITRVLVVPKSTNMSLLPPPPPLPVPMGPSDDDSGSEDHDDRNTKIQPPQLPTPVTAMIDSSSLSTPSLTLSEPLITTTSTAPAVSSSSSSSTTSESSRTRQTTLSTSITSSVPESLAPSSHSESDSTEAKSTLTSSTIAVSSISASDQASTATVLPIGQPDSPLETRAASSPLGTAGTVLAAIFGFVALITIIYLLHRLRRRIRQESSGPDSEKQNPIASTAQETGVIFGRRSSEPWSSPNRHTQNEGTMRGWGRSRFSFLNRNWYSTGTQFSNLQQQRQNRDQASQLETTTTATNTNNHSLSPCWPSPLFFSPTHSNPTLNPRSSPLANSQYYPPFPIPATPQTATTITRLATEIYRNISTRSSGSGHARAYAHHGISLPRFLVVNATRNTILSISSLLIRTRRRNKDSKVSNMTSPSLRSEALGSPVSEISELYHGDSARSPRPLSPPKYHGSHTPSPLRSPSPSKSGSTADQPRKPIQGHWSPAAISGSNHIRSHSSPKTDTNTDMTRATPHARRSSYTRFTDTPLPQLPLPVAVSRGSWGSKIGLEL